MVGSNTTSEPLLIVDGEDLKGGGYTVGAEVSR